MRWYLMHKDAGRWWCSCSSTDDWSAGSKFCGFRKGSQWRNFREFWN